MATQRRSNIDVLERGDIFFLYRPNEERYEPGDCWTSAAFTWSSIPRGRSGSV